MTARRVPILHRPVLVIVGPTGVGKTSLSLAVARRRPCTVISADSRLFYRGMDIGTAKPGRLERATVPHELVDICDPDETLSLGEFQDRVFAAIERAHGTGRLPVLVGGTGQYVRAVVEGWGIPRVPPQPALRDCLYALGGPELARWLRALDPVAAERIHPHNLRRMVRALEVTLTAGEPISRLQHKRPPPYRFQLLGLTCPRADLYERIDRRVDQMMAAGLLRELQALRDAGYGRSLPSMSALGYAQLWSYLDGELSLDEAVERIKFETHRFVRHQNNWFRLDDPTIHWFDVQAPAYPAAALTTVEQWLDTLPSPPSAG
jgi:tRNA dimethylallyltransferase